MSKLTTWITSLGVKLTVAGKGGPWTAITPHSVPAKKRLSLQIPMPPGVDAGWYYRNGWQPRVESVTPKRSS